MSDDRSPYHQNGLLQQCNPSQQSLLEQQAYGNVVNPLVQQSQRMMDMQCEDRRLPVVQQDIGAQLQQPIAPSATWTRVAEEKQRQIDDLNQQLARYCTTIDTQRALIADLECDRDAWMEKAQEALANTTKRNANIDLIEEGLELVRTSPAFPHTALRSAPWTPVV